MWASNRRSSQPVPNLSARLGRLEAAPIGRVPNLPNLPNLSAHPRVYAHVGERVHLRVRTHTPVFFRYGRLGRLGRSSGGNGFKVPNLVLEVRKVGNTAEGE